jgi:hypothetical protein
MRCGAAVRWGRSVCSACNPAGLPAPSRSQYHAVVYLSVLAALVLVAVTALIHG